MSRPIRFARAVMIPSGLSLLAFVLTIVFFSFGIESLGSLAFLIAWVLIFDAGGRAKDYSYLLTISPKRRVCLYGRYMRTACGRQVMIAVSPPAAVAYYDYGYRWYHIFPDKTFTKDSPFLKVTFWRQLFYGHRGH